MNVVKEQGRNRGKTQHYMLTADPTLLRSCWEVEREETEDGTEAVKNEDRRGNAAQKVGRGPEETPNKKRLFGAKNNLLLFAAKKQKKQEEVVWKIWNLGSCDMLIGGEGER